jgi:hypothetical protein
MHLINILYNYATTTVIKIFDFGQREVISMHGCISINRQLTSPMKNNFAGKRSMECKQNKDV